MKKFELSEQLVNDIGAYLVERPFKEVAPLFGRLQQEVNEAIAKVQKIESDKVSEVKDEKNG